MIDCRVSIGYCLMGFSNPIGGLELEDNTFIIEVTEWNHNYEGLNFGDCLI